MPKTKLSLEQIVFRFFMARAKGKTHGYQGAAKRYVLLEYLQRKQEFKKVLLNADTDRRSPDRLMRTIVRKMQKNGYRIGSHSLYGYFAIKTPRDLELAVEQRYKQMIALSQCIRWERRNFQNKTQRRLNLKGAAA
jgi:hypothetical protein